MFTSRWSSQKGTGANSIPIKPRAAPATDRRVDVPFSPHALLPSLRPLHHPQYQPRKHSERLSPPAHAEACVPAASAHMSITNRNRETPKETPQDTGQNSPGRPWLTGEVSTYMGMSLAGVTCTRCRNVHRAPRVSPEHLLLPWDVQGTEHSPDQPGPAQDLPTV